MKGSKMMSNRPVYRGNKGIQDGHIPRGKKKKNSKKPEQNKYENEDISCSEDNIYPTKVSTVLSMEHSSIEFGANSNIPLEDDKKQELVSVEETNSEHATIIKEIKHVRKRIRHIQESIQLSVNIAQPNVWEDNCLNAVVNCVNEWRSIVSFHGSASISFDNTKFDDGATSSCEEIIDEQNIVSAKELKVSITDIAKVDQQVLHGEEHPMHPNNEWSKTTSLQIYGLIQMAMQTGPLKGSNAGYFKRCGKDVAIMARVFLTKCVNSSNDIQPDKLKSLEDGGSTESVLKDLYFTPKQKDSIKKWMKNADAAIAADKPPSKSALKLQKSVNTKGMSRKDKRRKGKPSKK